MSNLKLVSSQSNPVEKLELISRQEAIAQGLKYYFTGEACKHGHVSKRRVNKGDCVECKNKSTLANLSKWIKANPEALKPCNRREYISAKSKRYKKRYPEKVAALRMARRAKIKESQMDDFSCFVAQEAVRLAKSRQEMTGYAWHVDHMIPLSLGGKHSYENLQVIPAFLNLKKSNKMWLTKPMEWVDAMQENCVAMAA